MVCGIHLARGACGRGPINRPVRVVTKDGTTINGRRLNEDTYSLQTTPFRHYWDGLLAKRRLEVELYLDAHEPGAEQTVRLTPGVDLNGRRRRVIELIDRRCHGSRASRRS